MIKRIGIINVGVNASHGILRSPIFDDNTFEFVPIPTCELGSCPVIGDCSQCLKEFVVFPRYRELKSLAAYIPEKYLDMRVHNDPEFKTYTYGDFANESKASNLKKLERGDLLVFLSRLLRWRDGFTNEAGFYLIGYFEIETIVDNEELCEIVKTRGARAFHKIKENAHLKTLQYSLDLWRQVGWDESWIFRGSNRSKKFKYAIPFDRKLADRVMLDAEGEKWFWRKNKTEIQTIGSYTRTCPIIEDKKRIDKFWKVIRKFP